MEPDVSKNISIKDEPMDDYLENSESMEDATTVEGGTTNADVDPMNLLEIVAERCSSDDPEVTQTTGSAETEGILDKWSQWIKTYPWLLRRTEGGKRCGFCLYCGKNLNVEGVYNLERHNCALIHKERQQNYETFLNSLKETLDEEGLTAIKEEIDADNTGKIAEELITKRLERSKALNDFNWSHWLSAHSWLVRENSEDELSTKGYCKYCKCVFDVEFSLTRQRHEQSIKHKLGEQQLDESGNLNKANDNETVAGGDDNNQNNIDNHVTSKVLKGRLFDKVSSSNKHRMCRVCRVIIDKHSCRKHMKTKLHRRNMQALAISYRKDKQLSVGSSKSNNNLHVDWSKYTRMHSWICADPDDPKYAYCSTCEKRFMYGLSSIKRALHEKSQSHCEAVKKKFGNLEQDNGGIMSDLNGFFQNEAVVATLDYDCEAGESAANESLLKRKRAIFNDRWFELNPCYQRNEDDEDYIYCKCCNVSLLIKNLNIGKHERCERHKVSAQQFLADNKVTNTTETKKVRRDSQSNVRLSWMRRTKNGQTFCKFCKVLLSVQYKPAVHERTERHKLAAQRYFERKNEQDIQSFQAVHEDNMPAFVGIPVDVTVDDVSNVDEIKPAITCTQENVMNWQEKYEWLTFSESEIRQFYGYCNCCKQSVFVPTATFATKHECGSTHIRAQMNHHQQQQQRRQSELESSQMSMSKSEEAAHKYQLYKWLLPDPEDNRSFGYCKYCKTRIMTEGLMALGHHNSRSHRMATQLYLENRRNDASDDTNQSSLMDGNGHTIEPYQNLEAVLNTEETSSEQSLATRLTHAHAEMLSLIRDVKGKHTLKNKRSINNKRTLSRQISATASISSQPTDCEQNIGAGGGGGGTAKQRANNTYDLFFESMKETVKKLPSDLAAESRVKIMQIVYDLEMRALQRTKAQESEMPNTEPPSPQADERTLESDALQQQESTGISAAKPPILDADTENVGSATNNGQPNETIPQPNSD